MDLLSPDQLAAKVLYLERENAQLRAESLDLKVRAGLIRLAPPSRDREAEAAEGGGEDG